MAKKLLDPKSTGLGTSSAGPFFQVVDVPDGVYAGIWGGFQVTMTYGSQTILFTTADGINGGLAVKVTVTGGQASVQV